MSPEAAALVERLRLVAHPEGGFFREVFRSSHSVHPADGRAVRSAVTTIYYLLAEGQISRWHRVRSDEIWHFYDGDPLELSVCPASGAGGSDGPAVHATRRVSLGRLRGSDVPVHVVPAGHWQSARPLGAYSLVGCTVAPGFDFDDFLLLE
jgi:predicted cupin superfamily sugar epimerase